MTAVVSAALAGTAVALAVAGLLARRYLVTATIQGRSMAPAYRDGDLVLVRRTSIGRLRHGQVVVIRRPDPSGHWPADLGAPRDRRQRWMIKRVTALPGDPVPRAGVPALADRTESYVPAGMLVVLGDNQAASYDSRQIGYIPAESVLGVAIRTVRRADGPILVRTPPSTADPAAAERPRG